MNVLYKEKGKEKQKSKIKGAAKHDYQYNYISHNDEMFSDHHFPGYDGASTWSAIECMCDAII